MMDAERIRAYADTSLKTLIASVDMLSSEAGEEGRPWHEGMLYTAARRLEQLERGWFRRDSCREPDPDVEWFQKPHVAYYRPISTAGHKVFDDYGESESYPGFYGFCLMMPDRWPHLTFVEITPPEPSW